MAITVCCRLAATTLNRLPRARSSFRCLRAPVGSDGGPGAVAVFATLALPCTHQPVEGACFEVPAGRLNRSVFPLGFTLGYCLGFRSRLGAKQRPSRGLAVAALRSYLRKRIGQPLLYGLRVRAGTPRLPGPGVYRPHSGCPFREGVLVRSKQIGASVFFFPLPILLFALLFFIPLTSFGFPLIVLALQRTAMSNNIFSVLDEDDSADASPQVSKKTSKGGNKSNNNSGGNANRRAQGNKFKNNNNADVRSV